MIPQFLSYYERNKGEQHQPCWCKHPLPLRSCATSRREEGAMASKRPKLRIRSKIYFRIARIPNEGGRCQQVSGLRHHNSHQPGIPTASAHLNRKKGGNCARGGWVGERGTTSAQRKTLVCYSPSSFTNTYLKL